MRYRTLLFDLDHTLLDSDESERLAYAHTMHAIGLADPDAHFERYVAINQAMWRAVEAGTIKPSEVRHRRFEQFAAEVGIDADPHAMADEFVFGLANFGELYPGASDVLAELSEVATIGMITNGLSDVQRRRIERLGIADFFDSVVISSEVDVTKPRPEIFDIAFEQLGRPPRETALMIGDSLTSDIAGGRNYGIATCWYNPHDKPAPLDEITHVISSLGALPATARS